MVCLRENPLIVFLPCWHVCCCQGCGEKRYLCFICNRRIKAKKALPTQEIWSCNTTAPELETVILHLDFDIVAITFCERHACNLNLILYVVSLYITYIYISLYNFTYKFNCEQSLLTHSAGMGQVHYKVAGKRTSFLQLIIPSMVLYFFLDQVLNILIVTADQRLLFWCNICLHIYWLLLLLYIFGNKSFLQISAFFYRNIGGMQTCPNNAMQ